MSTPHSDTLRARMATPDDAAAITRIYNQGIDDGATFETRHRTPDEILAWFGPLHPVIVAEAAAEVVAFARTMTYRTRECYAGIAEYSVYVAREARGRGAGNAAMEYLIARSADAGLYKLVARIIAGNGASLRLMARHGFREVGYYEKHGRLRGEWRDTVVVEKILEQNLDRW